MEGKHRLADELKSHEGLGNSLDEMIGFLVAESFCEDGSKRFKSYRADLARLAPLTERECIDRIVSMLSESRFEPIESYGYAVERALKERGESTVKRNQQSDRAKWMNAKGRIIAALGKLVKESIELMCIDQLETPRIQMSALTEFVLKRSRLEPFCFYRDGLLNEALEFHTTA